MGTFSLNWREGFALLLGLGKKPFLLHCIIEVPASINFLLFPSSQLRLYSPQSHAIIRQYATLLFSSVLISWIFATRDNDDLSGKAAAALALYHLAPMARASSRLRNGQARWQSTLFLFFHTVCFGSLLHLSWTMCMHRDIKLA